jgi:threonine synthase
MDIGISSNFERLLFELLGRDAGLTAAIMANSRSTGRMDIPQAAWREARAVFEGFRLGDEETIAEIRHLYERCGYLADPHTAIGLAAARALAPADLPAIAAATAHPAKFPDAMQAATGQHPPLPAALAHLYEAAENYSVAPNDLGQIQASIRAFVSRNQT